MFNLAEDLSTCVVAATPLANVADRAARSKRNLLDCGCYFPYPGCFVFSILCISPQRFSLAPLTCAFSALTTRSMHNDEQVTYPEIGLGESPMLDLKSPTSRPPRPVDLAFRESLPDWREPAHPANLLPTINGGSSPHDQTASLANETTLQGAQLWTLIGGLYLAVYLVGLDLSMLSTVGSTYQPCRRVGTDRTCSRY